MIEDVALPSMVHLKNYHFALSYQVRKRLNAKMYVSLYKLAKANLGVRSMLFGLDKWVKLSWRGDLLHRGYASGLFASLEVDERYIRNRARMYERMLETFIHEGVMRQQWEDVSLDVSLAKATYSQDTKDIATKFWDEEDPTVIQILADSLDDEGACFEADHLRLGHVHSPACAVVMRVLKGITT